MQKTEKHCKNQCFCYHKTTKISPKTGPKTQKSASGPGHLRNRKKRCCKPKNWGQKVEKHGVFSLFACRFWTGAFTNRCLPYCFLQCFLKASVTTYQKQKVLAEKCPPPGKPVTFCECHPEDHAPAPSVRADLGSCLRFNLMDPGDLLFRLPRPSRVREPTVSELSGSCHLYSFIICEWQLLQLFAVGFWWIIASCCWWVPRVSVNVVPGACAKGGAWNFAMKMFGAMPANALQQDEPLERFQSLRPGCLKMQRCCQMRLLLLKSGDVLWHEDCLQQCLVAILGKCSWNTGNVAAWGRRSQLEPCCKCWSPCCRTLSHLVTPLATRRSVIEYIESLHVLRICCSATTASCSKSQFWQLLSRSNGTWWNIVEQCRCHRCRS